MRPSKAKKRQTEENLSCNSSRLEALNADTPEDQSLPLDKSPREIAGQSKQKISIGQSLNYFSF